MAIDSYSLLAPGTGFLSIALNLTNVTSLQVVTECKNCAPITMELLAPSTNVLLDWTNQTDAAKTTALTNFNGRTNSLPYPALVNVDPAVVNGTYIQKLGMASTYDVETVQGTIIAKQNINLSRLTGGTLHVNLFYVGQLAQSQSSRIAIENALSTLWQTYKNAANIDIKFTSFDVISDTGILPYPRAGSDFYLTNGNRDGVFYPGVNIYFGDWISLIDSTAPGANLYGIESISPSIPGPAVSSPSSGIAISLKEHQNNLGNYGLDDMRHLGETMAFEIGHYLGLFEPVGSTSINNPYTEKDPLTDTPTCSNLAECTAIGLTSNVMFPFYQSPVPRVSLTTQQIQVLYSQVVVN